MIKSTFNNLPKEKQNRIINAIINEFASTDTEKVSINRIIKSAGISRGSFYQYFDDKVDLVEVLVKVCIDFADEKFLKSIALSDGDIFNAYINLFEAVAEIKNDKKQKVILKNFCKNIKANDDLVSDYLLNRFNNDGVGDFRCKHSNFDRSRLRFNSDNDIDNLCQILTQIMKNAFFNIFVKGDSVEQVRASFRRKIEIIKKGAVIN